MVAVERRLEQMETALSGRDRARLYVRAVSRGEEPDDRLERSCPASERAQFDAVRQAVERGVTEVWQRLLFEIEWLNNDDVSLGWLECVAGFVGAGEGRVPGMLPGRPGPGRA